MRINQRVKQIVAPIVAPIIEPRLQQIGFYIITVFILSLSLDGIAQTESLVVDSSQVVVMARPNPFQMEIRLRWAVTTSSGWKRANKYGYEVRRYTIYRRGELLDRPEVRTLGQFFPKPLEEWADILDTNDYAAIIAQSLYGEEFNVEGLDKISAVVNLSMEQEQRFSWALFAADQDFEAAEMAGLAFTDRSIEREEKYLYKVVVLNPEERFKFAEGMVYTGLNEYYKLPSPIDVTVLPTGGSMVVSWDCELHKEMFSSYFIERSTDKKSFERVNREPIIALNSGGKDQNRIYYIDSVEYNTTYHYRVIGKTQFGELSSYSEIKDGEIKKSLDHTAHIVSKHMIDDKRVKLKWEFAEDKEVMIDGFNLNRSDEVDGLYEEVISNIDPSVREIEYKGLKRTNYFTLTAVGKNGTESISLPKLVQPVDSMPPKAPVDVKGEIDSLGVVTLSWRRNREEDMLGYRVFRGNTSKEEMSQLTVSPHNGTTYYDSVSVKSLNSKIYYQIVAVDERFNNSSFSDTITLKRPDIIPPTSPIIDSYSIEGDTLNISWVNSSSDDVVSYKILRQESKSSEWEVIYRVKAKKIKKREKDYEENEETKGINTSSFQDLKAEPGLKYRYQVIAVDDSDLESEPTRPLTVSIPRVGLKPAIQKLRSYVNKEGGYLEIYWKEYEQKDVYELAIYRGGVDSKLTLLRNVPPTTKRIVDNKVKPNNSYKYLIRAIFKDGSVSEVSDIIVKY